MASKLNEDKPQGGRTPYIDASSAMGAYTESKLWLRRYHEPIDEFERIARNRPKDNIPDGLPKLTEGTTAAIVQENPRRVIQQLATGQVRYSNNPAYAAVADVVHRRLLLPSYEMNGTALQKGWNMQSKALIWGMSASYTFFTFTNGKFHTDFSIPYIKDIGIEKGKVFAGDSNVAWMRSWYTKSDIKRIINREKAMEKSQKGYKSDWNLPALAGIMDTSGITKPSQYQTPAEREKGADGSGGYEIIHIFQEGKGAEFYSFSPQYKEGTVLRTKINSDPRGKMPLDFEYCNVDLSNPLGRGMVELAGPVQNLMDQKLQQHSYMSTLMMGPPLQVWGNVAKSSLKYRPNAIWDMGTAANNKVEPFAINNEALTNFVPDMQFLQAKIQALFSNQDSSISSDVGNAGQSKTQAGVKQQAARVGVADNYFTKQHEAWFRDQAETSLNIFFAEMKGQGELHLEGDDLNHILDSPAAQLVDENDTLHIPYDDINSKPFTFEVDPASSTADDDLDQLQKLQETIKEVGESGPVLSYYLGQSGMKLNVGELYKQQFERMGLKNLQSILTKMTPEEAQQAQQAPFPIIDKPQIRINSQDLSPEEKTAALQAGGVQVQPPQPGQPPADPLQSASAQAQLDYHVELIKAQAAANQAQSADSAPQGPNSDELALRQQELAIKKQTADQGDAKIAIEAEKTAHQHALALDKHVHDQHMSIITNQQQQEQAKLAAKQPQGPAKK